MKMRNGSDLNESVEIAQAGLDKQADICGEALCIESIEEPVPVRRCRQLRGHETQRGSHLYT
jgi:hypothetical protein